MKTKLVLLLILFVVPLKAGFKMNLGRAASKQAAEVVDEAVKKKAQIDSSTNDTDTSLASCGSGALFSVSPLLATDMIGLVPLGNVSPSGHTIPTGHVYFHIRRNNLGNPLDFTQPSATVTVRAPGNIRVTQVSRVTNLGNSYTNYSVYFSPCKEFEGYFLHMTGLESSLDAELASGATCFDNAVGTTTFRNCNKEVSVDFTAGQTLGQAGGSPENAMDFGARDSRITSLAYANSSRYAVDDDGFDRHHVVCPVDYYSSSVKSTLEARFGDTTGNILRTESPVCGEVEQDVANTAQGNWFEQGISNGAEERALALHFDNVVPSTGVFSVGSSQITGLSIGQYGFYPTSSGFVNRRFNEVTNDGNVYCYESLIDGWVVSTNTIEANTIVILQLISATTLRIERQTAASCGAGPWTFGGSAVTFER